MKKKLKATRAKRNFVTVLFLWLLFILSFSGCGDSRRENAAKTDYAGLHVEGTRLLDKEGSEVVLRGINHAHSWYREMDETAIEAIYETGVNSVRLVLSDGERWQKDKLIEIQRLIELCKERQLYVILEVHDPTGSNDIESLNKAADYWIEMKEALVGNEEFVIVNLANEWVGKWNSKLWREGYTQVIPKIRDAGIMNTIMVDAAGWGQYGKSIKKYGRQVFDADICGNTMFSVHMYGTAGRNKSTIEKNLSGVTSQNLCVCVGEFGYTHSDGNVDEEYLMNYCNDNSIGFLAWSWKGNSDEVGYLDLALEWDGSVMSEDWGKVFLREIEKENNVK